MAYTNYYFKRGKGLISGIDLPDKVEGENFYDCDFHPNCDTVQFINCHFENCYGVEDLNLKDCTVK